MAFGTAKTRSKMEQQGRRSKESTRHSFSHLGMITTYFTFPVLDCSPLFLVGFSLAHLALFVNNLCTPFFMNNMNMDPSLNLIFKDHVGRLDWGASERALHQSLWETLSYCLFGELKMENVKDMAISFSFLAKAKINSLLRGIDSIIDGFKADISKVGHVEIGALKSSMVVAFGPSELIVEFRPDETCQSAPPRLQRLILQRKLPASPLGSSSWTTLLQVDDDFSQNVNSKALSNPNFNELNIPHSVKRVHNKVVSEEVHGEDSEEANQVTVRLLVPSNQIGCVIGKGGQIIQSIRSESGAQIRILKDDHLPSCSLSSNELIQISREPFIVRKILYQIASRLHDNPSRSQHLFVYVVPIGYSSSGSLMGLTSGAPIIGLAPLVGTYGGYRGDSGD
ncbi:KH domain-containing protein HEN4 [Vitis vinifera]|uniref:KH domain-containing protein HEN4 n=1 Tax=Vitis vinifera TaxID=29760 RepID=A0A438K7J2_VITVI|nr:KH domain-containing protein HEN4 [Vitis vinifera]